MIVARQNDSGQGQLRGTFYLSRSYRQELGYRVYMQTPAHFDRLGLAVAIASVIAYEDIRLI
jgi:hypothetical protein